MGQKIIAATLASGFAILGLLAACSEETSPSPGSSGTASGGTSGGGTASGGTSGGGTASGGTSGGGTSGGGTSGGAQDSGTDSGTDGAVTDPTCATYCTCMTTMCPASTIPGAGNDCLSKCMALPTGTRTCRKNHCGYAGSVNDTTHCPHAIGVGACP